MQMGADQHLKVFVRNVTDDPYTLKVAREINVRLEKVLEHIKLETRVQTVAQARNSQAPQQQSR